MKEINVDFIEQTEEGLVKKNFTTKMELVDGLEATIQSLESQIANAGKVDSVNNKQGDVVLTGSDLMVSMSWSEKISDVLWDMYTNKADSSSVVTSINDKQGKVSLDAYTLPMSSHSPRWTVKDEFDRRAFSSDVEELQEKTEHYTKPSLYKGDMNDLVTMGRYYVADTTANKPGSGGWFVDVYVANIQNNGQLHKYQVAYKMTGEKRVFARNQFGGSWTEWQRVDGMGIEKVQDDIKELFQSGVESNKTLVDALNSMSITASTNDTIKTNANKVKAIPVNGSLNRTISMQNGSVNISPGYYLGGQVKANITNLTSNNIKKGVSVGGVYGSYVPRTSYSPVIYQGTLKAGAGNTVRLPIPFTVVSGTLDFSDGIDTFDVVTGEKLSGAGTFISGAKMEGGALKITSGPNWDGGEWTSSKLKIDLVLEAH